MLSLDGMVMWAFGDGDYGKLGTGSSTAKYYPQVLKHNQMLKYLTNKVFIDQTAVSGDKMLSLCFLICREWSHSVKKELKRSVAVLSSLWLWPVTDTFTRLDKVHQSLGAW